jgi:hypothetical protein
MERQKMGEGECENIEGRAKNSSIGLTEISEV